MQPNTRARTSCEITMQYNIFPSTHRLHGLLFELWGDTSSGVVVEIWLQVSVSQTHSFPPRVFGFKLWAHHRCHSLFSVVVHLQIWEGFLLKANIRRLWIKGARGYNFCVSLWKGTRPPSSPLAPRNTPVWSESLSLCACGCAFQIITQFAECTDIPQYQIKQAEPHTVGRKFKGTVPP